MSKKNAQRTGEEVLWLVGSINELIIRSGKPFLLHLLGGPQDCSFSYLLFISWKFKHTRSIVQVVNHMISSQWHFHIKFFTMCNWILYIEKEFYVITVFKP